MLLIDLSGVAYHKVINFYANEERPDIADVKRVLLTELKEYEELYSSNFGHMIICADSKPYWRSEVQPSYKQNRLKARETSTINSEAFYEDLAIIKQDIVEYSNWVMLDIKRAEADDLIAILTKYARDNDEKVLIISSDKDMLQLQTRHEEVYQFSPNRNKLLTLENTEYDLLTHFLKGDTSDGIPNVFSPEDHFMIEGDKPRQKSITKKIIADVREHFDDITKCTVLDENAIKRFKQNQELIDTSYTPKDLAILIVKVFEVMIKEEKEDRLEEFLSPFEAEDEEEEEEEVTTTKGSVRL